MSTYHIYLPPELAPLDAVRPADLPLAFRSVPRPHPLETLSQPLDAHESLLDRLRGLPSQRDRKGKRKATGNPEGEPPSGLDDDTSSLAPRLPAPVASSGDSTSRRRSRRLHHPYPMDQLPGLQEADSIVSLNTTVSQPSHPSPSALSGDTSMHNLPHWTVPLARLSLLPALLRAAPARDHPESSPRVCLIACVTGTTRPMARRTKLERARGQDGTLWLAKWDVVAPSAPGPSAPAAQQGEVGCTVVLWDKCAKEHGETVRRGDVVLLEHTEFRPASKRDKAQLVLSPSFPDPRVTILYRTLPRYESKSDYIRSSPRFQRPEGVKIVPEDAALRPDLRVGRSDPAVRRVAEVSRWFAGWIGGEPP